MCSLLETWKGEKITHPGDIVQRHEYARSQDILLDSLLMFLPITRHAMPLINEYSLLSDVQTQGSPEPLSPFYCLIKPQKWTPLSSS